MLCQEGRGLIGGRMQCHTLTGQVCSLAPRLAPPQPNAQPRLCQRNACVTRADGRPTAIARAVTVDRPQLASEPIADSTLPCPRQGIKNDATELVGYTPMVRKPPNQAFLRVKFAKSGLSRVSLVRMQVYLNRVNERCYARIACKLESMEPCKR